MYCPKCKSRLYPADDEPMKKYGVCSFCVTYNKREVVREQEGPCDTHNYVWSDYCGAKVCTRCNDHKGLAKCYCGYGLAEGERLEDDIGDATFNGKTWDVDY